MNLEQLLMKLNPGDKVINKTTKERGTVVERLEAGVAVETEHGTRRWAFEDLKLRKLFIVDVEVPA